MACIIFIFYLLYTLETFMFAGLAGNYGALIMKNTIFIATGVRVVLVYQLIMGNMPYENVKLLLLWT